MASKRAVTCCECRVSRSDRSRFCSKKCLVAFQQAGFCDHCGPHTTIAVRDPPNGFCSDACRQKSKAFWAIPRAFRAACLEFAETGACLAGSRCYERHCVVSQNLPHDLLVICTYTHAARVAEYLRSGELAGELMLEVVGEHKPDVTSGNAKGGCDNRLLFVRVLVEGEARKDARSRAHTIISQDANLANAVHRVYAVSCAVATNAKALESVADSLIALGKPAMGVRAMGFPPALQHQLAMDISADPRFVLHPAHSADAGLCAFAFEDRTEVGTFSCPYFPGSVSSTEVVPCRAALKLQEVRRRCADIWTARTAWIAADVGASPGGWTSVLVDLGAAHVFAIDPAELSPSVLTRAEVEHIAERVEDCTPALLTNGVLLDVIVCDMNCSPRIAVDAVLALLPVTRPGATLVITLKKFGRAAEMASAIEVEAGRLRAVLGTSLRVLHLFSGGIDERTVVGRLLANLDSKIGLF